MTALTVGFASAASTTVSTADQLYVVAGVSTPGFPFVFNFSGGATGYGQLWAQGNAGGWLAAGSIGSQDGHGFLLENSVLNLEGQTLAAGNWTPTIRLTSMTSSSAPGGTITADIIVRISKRSSGGTYTTIATSTLTGASLTSTATSFNLPAASGAATAFATGDKLYIDVWLNITASTVGASGGVRLNRESNDTTGLTFDPNAQIVSPGYSPSVTINTMAATDTIPISDTLLVQDTGMFTEASSLSDNFLSCGMASWSEGVSISDSFQTTDTTVFLESIPGNETWLIIDSAVWSESIPLSDTYVGVSVPSTTDQLALVSGFQALGITLLLEELAASSGLLVIDQALWSDVLAASSSLDWIKVVFVFGQITVTFVTRDGLVGFLTRDGLVTFNARG